MDINLFKTYQDGKIEIVANVKEPFKQEEKMLMELWESGTKEEQKKFAHTLLEMMQDKNR
ncbi:DUF3243 family protein [Sporosarcina psychrophila]|uniref:Uncharacterized protein n=1 Tax=Sporosarcina psychrophila TaxID=1476 RepID=A0ABV2K9Q5_SPOPS